MRCGPRQPASQDYLFHLCNTCLPSLVQVFAFNLYVFHWCHQVIPAGARFVDCSQACSDNACLQALALFEAESGHMPDIVVFASNFWEIMRLRLFNATALWEGVFHEQVLRWLSDAEADVAHLKVSMR